MNEFIFLYRNTDEAHREAMGSPEKAQQSMKKWRVWLKGLTDGGHLKSIGQPLERVGKVVGGKKKTVTDGPYAETKDIIGGYSIVEAKNLDQAAQFAAGCPVLEYGGSVEVRPVMQLNL
ncbi:MAG: YciI family protein [Nitrospiria bacterium]